MIAPEEAAPPTATLIESAVPVQPAVLDTVLAPVAACETVAPEATPATVPPVPVNETVPIVLVAAGRVTDTAPALTTSKPEIFAPVVAEIEVAATRLSIPSPAAMV